VQPVQGILDHSGALVMTDRTLSTSAVKYKGSSTTALDHARLDVWFLDTVKMHALDTKWDVLNDMKNVLTVGANFGTIIVDITQLRTGDSQASASPTHPHPSVSGVTQHCGSWALGARKL
jgi:hypothetical protein